MPGDKNAKLAMLFFLALLLFNFPLMGIFGKGGTVMGLPTVFVYLMGAWALVIGGTFAILRRGRGRRP